MLIRNERATDAGAITDVTVAAFAHHPYSQHTEQFVIARLREAGQLTLSLVAEVDGQVVGHVAFSPVTLSDGTPDWYGVGPLSVLPAHQRQGLGTALMTEGLARMKARGARGCALVGDPAYYVRFGFRNDPRLVHEGVPQEVFLVLPFTDEVPTGTVVFHEAFLATS